MVHTSTHNNTSMPRSFLIKSKKQHAQHGGSTNTTTTTTATLAVNVKKAKLEEVDHLHHGELYPESDEQEIIVDIVDEDDELESPRSVSPSGSLLSASGKHTFFSFSHPSIVR